MERRTGKHMQVLGSLLIARGGREPGEGEQGFCVLRQVPARYFGSPVKEVMSA